MECESLSVCHLRQLKLPHANALMHEHVPAHTHACTYARTHTTHTHASHTHHTPHTHTHTHTAQHSEETGVTGGRRAGCPRVPCMAAGRKPHCAVGPHHLQNGGVHGRCRCGQETFPQWGHSLNHHPARVCRGQYSLVTCFGGHQLFSKCTVTEPDIYLVFCESVLWPNTVSVLSFLKVYYDRTRYVSSFLKVYCHRTWYVSHLFWKCTVTEPVCVSSFFDSLLWQNQVFVWWLGWFPLQTF